MKENNDLKIKNNSINKNEKLEQDNSNSNKYIKYSTNIIKKRNYYKAYINKKYSSNQIKEKDDINKIINSNNAKPISKNYNTNNLIKSYSNKKDIYNSNEKIDNDRKIQNLSGYKQILDKMVEKYAINENSKEKINNLLKKNITSQKYLLLKKSKNFSPSLKKHVLDKNISTKNKFKYFSGDNRSIKKKNESYMNKVVKLQAFWRGYYLRNIVVRGLKKYYGLIYIYKLLKKYFLKKNKNIFEILFEKELKSKERKSANFNSKNNKFIYSKKFFYNSSNNSDKNSFSFSTPNDGTIENVSETKTKTFYSNDKINTNIKNKFNFTKLERNSKTKENTFTNQYKEINLNQNNINININNDNKNNFLINNYYGTKDNLRSNIIKGENNSKIGRMTYNFFNKYENKDIKPDSKDSPYYFRKPIYKKAQNKKYIYINKNIYKDDNFSEKINSSNSKYDSNNSLNNRNKLKFNNTLYNIYKFVFYKIINMIKKKLYNIYFPNFIYQLKIKRKIGQIKLYHSILLSIILKKEKKIKKKYLDIYREKVLTLKANELLKYEKNNNIDSQDIKKNKNKNKNKNLNIYKTYNENNNKSQIKLRNIKNTNSKINNKNKNILLKLLKIKNKYINKSIVKYFNKWKKKPFIMLSYNNKSNNNKYNNNINKKRNIIIVNKKKIKIKRDYKNNSLNNSQKIEDKSYSVSKEKKMKIIKRISKPDEYLLLYNSYSKNLRDSINKYTNNILNEEKNIPLNKIFYIINKLESKKLLFKFFKYWKKIKK